MSRISGLYYLVTLVYIYIYSLDPSTQPDPVKTVTRVVPHWQNPDNGGVPKQISTVNSHLRTAQVYVCFCVLSVCSSPFSEGKE